MGPVAPLVMLSYLYDEDTHTVVESVSVDVWTTVIVLAAGTIVMVVESTSVIVVESTSVAV